MPARTQENNNECFYNPSELKRSTGKFAQLTNSAIEPFKSQSILNSYNQSGMLSTGCGSLAMPPKSFVPPETDIKRIQQLYSIVKAGRIVHSDFTDQMSNNNTGYS